MFRDFRKSAAALAVLALGLGVGGVGIAGQFAGNDGPVRCEIVATSSGGTTWLESVVHSDVPAFGTYSFTVRSAGSAGSSDIRQGGEFEASAHESVSLGTISLNAGSGYDARLEISHAGQTSSCTSRIDI